MYYPLSEKRTRCYYKEILEDTLSISKANLEKYNTSLWQSIVNQLLDIKDNVIEKQLITDWEEIYDRYTLGTIAIQHFNDDDEMRIRLCDIFGGAVHYFEYPDQ